MVLGTVAGWHSSTVACREVEDAAAAAAGGGLEELTRARAAKRASDCTCATTGARGRTACRDAGGNRLTFCRAPFARQFHAPTQPFAPRHLSRCAGIPELAAGCHLVAKRLELINKRRGMFRVAPAAVVQDRHGL